MAIMTWCCKKDSLVHQKKNPSCFTYTLTLRVAFLVVLGVGAVVCGIVARNVTTDLEVDNGKAAYEDVSLGVLVGTKEHAERRRRGNEVLASIYRHAFPNASQWPNVALPGFQETQNILRYLSLSSFHTFAPFVRPDQGEAFLEFALEHYREQGIDESSSSGIATATKMGFWQFSVVTLDGENNLTAVPSDGTAPGFDYEYQIINPIFQSTHPLAGPYYLADTHHVKEFGEPIEEAIRCAEQAKSGDDCSVMSVVAPTVTVANAPATVYMTPIYPANDPTTIVGLMQTNFDWTSLLQDVAPGLVTGLYCVLSWGTEDDKAFTFILVSGEAIPVGAGDLHDRTYDESYGRSIILNEFGTNTTRYTLTVYPSSEWFEIFETNSTRTIVAGLVSIFAFCALVFLLYDYFMRGESRERRIILETKRRFVRFISHEIRTPLNTLLMGIELLQAELSHELVRSNDASGRLDHKKAGESWINLTKDIQENGENAVEILNDVLNYDKIETGKFVLEFSRVNVVHLLRSTVAAFNIHAKNSNIALNFSIESGWHGEDHHDVLRHGVIGDDTRLRQVVRNLVSNALKFAPETGGAVEVLVSFNPSGLPKAPSLVQRLTDFPEYPSDEKTPAPKRSGSISVYVIDNGAGMTAEQLSRLFQEGVQFDANKLQHGGGSGLGLYIARGLVDGHGGRLSVDSKGKGEGTTFTLELPLYDFIESELPDGFKSESRTSTTTDSSKDLPRSHHVLVVDDVATNRKMLIRLLERSGHTCVPAADGIEAIQKYEESQATENATKSGHQVFDCLLLDYEMPEMTGPEACSILREKGCTALIIGITGNVLAEDVAYFKSKGADEVLGKPCSLRILEEVWKKHIPSCRRHHVQPTSADFE